MEPRQSAHRNSGTNNVKRRPIQPYFFFGTAVRYLQDAADGWAILDTGENWRIRTNVQQVLTMMEDLNLRVSLQTDAAKKLEALLEEYNEAKEGATLSQEEAETLSKCVDALRKTLEAELRATFAYSVSPKRSDVGRLIDDPASLLAPNVFNKLPDIAKYDLREAGRAIAFELPTASAFHLMRAVESVLRQFYATVVRRGRRAKMWGEIVADIRTRRVAEKHQILLNHLDHIRSAFRNPTQHPDAQYDVQQAQDLWSLSVDVINRMAEFL